MKIINEIEQLADYGYSEKNIDWRELPMCCILTEDFIKRYEDKLNWEIVSMRQRIDIDFIENFKDKICWDKIIYNPHFSDDILIMFIEKFSLEDINNFFRMNPNSLKKEKILEKVKLLNKI